MNDMGDRIKERRQLLNLTMKELGDRVGVNASAVNKWEKGIVSNIPRSRIKALASVLECSPAWLMGIDDGYNIVVDAGMDDAQILIEINKLNDSNREAVRHYIQMCLKAQEDTN